MRSQEEDEEDAYGSDDLKSVAIQEELFLLKFWNFMYVTHSAD